MRHAALLLLLIGCDDPEPAGPELEVEVACAALHRIEGDALSCVHKGEIKLFVRGDKPEVRVDSNPAEHEVSAFGEGHLLVVPLDSDSEELRLVRAGRDWKLVLQVRAEPELLEELGPARTAESLRRIEQSLAEPQGPHRAALSSRAGRIALTLGDDDTALRHLQAASRAHREAGHLTEAIHDAVAAAWVWWWRKWDLRAAREALDEVDSLLPLEPLAAARVRQSRAAMLGETGALADAERELEAAAGLALRLGDESFVAELGIKRAELLHRLGRSDSAYTLLDQVEPMAAGCIAGDLLVTRTWLSLLDAGRGVDLRGERFAAAEAAYASCEASAEQRANAAINTALAALWRGDRAGAREALARSRRHGGGALVRAWELELRGRGALVEGEAEQALEAYTELSRRAALAGSFGEQWRGALGRGRALEALGRLDEAAAAYTQAEALLEQEQASLSLGSAPGFVGRRWQSASRLAALRIRQGRADSALALLRRARLRAIRVQTVPSAPRRDAGQAFQARRSLEADAAAAWTLPADELAALEAERRQRLADLERRIQRVAIRELSPRSSLPGELLVVVFPHESGRLVLAGPSDVQGELVEPGQWPSFVAERAAEAELVRVVGAAEHALAWPPVSVPVVHSLDLGDRPRARPEQGSGLVVIDPSGNLEGARQEGERMREQHPDATLLSGQDVTHERVVEELARAGWMHYAGHAEQGEGLQGGLRLAHGGMLRAADVLAMEKVPARVALNGCVTARGHGLVPIGVAQAFVLAGASEVLASAEVVSDRETAYLHTRLVVGSWGGTHGWAPLISSHPGFARFRVIVP